VRHPSFSEAFRFWLKLGLISFGGPTGQIAIMHTELVEKRRWISEARFLHALNYCMLLPGPEAQQLATYVGWLLHKTWGGIVAGALFVLPSALILWVLSYAYVVYGNVPWVAAIFAGLQPAVLAIVAAAVLRIGSKALKNDIMWAIAGAAFVGIYVFAVPFPVIMITAAVIGFIGGKTAARQIPRDQRTRRLRECSVLDDDTAVAEHHGVPSVARCVQGDCGVRSVVVGAGDRAGAWLGSGMRF
jgi:chromate transporter